MIWLWIALVVLIVVVIAVFLLSPLIGPSPIDLKNAHVVITGGSSGIGKALGEEAVLRGAKVTLIARNKKKLDEAKDAISALVPGKDVVRVASVDLCGEFEPVEKAVSEAESSLGPIDMLINCAGGTVPGRFDEVPISNFQEMLDLNFLSTVKMTRAVLPGMKARGRGRLVCVSSQAGQLGVYGMSAYSASKFAIKGFAEALQMELKPFNIHMTLSFPPDTDTPGLEEENKTKPKETMLISATSGLIQPEVVAKTILNDSEKGQFLSSLGLEGWMLTILTCGFAPIASLSEVLQQVFFMGVFRIIALGLLVQFNGIVRHRKNTNQPEEYPKPEKKSS